MSLAAARLGSGRQLKDEARRGSAKLVGYMHAGVAIEGLQRGAYPRRIVPASRPAVSVRHLEVTR